MTPRAATTLMSWLNSRMEREKAQALALLPSAVADRLRQMPSPEPVAGLVEPIAERLNGIHYSWFAPALSRLPPSQRTAAERALPAGHSGLRELPALVLEYWQCWLWKHVVEKNWLPTKMVQAPSAIRPLLHLNKSDLIQLIDLLGVFDVVPTLRHAIHSTEQKFWSEVLTAKQKKLAQKLLQQPSWPGQLPLEGFGSSVPEASRALHQRGCLRLGAALHGMDDALLWQIAHRLDTGRGDLVRQAAAQPMTAEAHAAALRALTLVLPEVSARVDEERP